MVLKLCFYSAFCILHSALFACGGKTAWKPVADGGGRYAGAIGFTASLPAQWLLFEDKPTRSLLLTRHSVSMDFIHLKRYPLFTPLPYTRLAVNAGMKIYEVAEVVASNLRATSGIYDLVILQSAPSAFGGLDGFELHLSYTMENGMRRRCLIYGAIINDEYYAEAGLYALEDHYFDAALDDFLTLVASLKIN